MIAKIAFAILPPSAAFRRNPPQIAATRRELPHGDSRCVTERHGALRFVAIRTHSLRLVATRCHSLPLAAGRGRSGSVGGESEIKRTKAKKANGYFRKPNNPRLYDNETLLSRQKPRKCKQKMKNVCIYSLYVCRFRGNADRIIIGGSLYE